jgi:membrane dipeptidase
MNEVTTISDTTRELLSDSLIWDDHAGFEPGPSVDLSLLEKWRTAGVNFLSLNVGYDRLTWQEAVKTLGAYIAWFERHGDFFTLCRTADDVLRAKKEGKMAIAFDLEGMNALDGELYMVSLFYRLGVRQMLIAYNRNNLAGGGCHDEDEGLTNFGRRVIAEMNRVGMVVDCSHTGHRTSMEVMALATQPVIFSHSNPMAVHGHGRNIADEQIRACAQTGGVIGVNGIGRFLADHQASTRAIVDCIEYIADLVGSDHIGIGLDHYFEPADSFLGMSTFYWPPNAGYGDEGCMRVAEPAQVREIAEVLLKSNWRESEVRKVLGENFLRIARLVWKQEVGA